MDSNELASQIGFLTIAVDRLLGDLRERPTLDEALNSRQARRERLLGSAVQRYLACPDQGEWAEDDILKYVDKLLDASDALDTQRKTNE